MGRYHMGDWAVTSGHWRCGHFMLVDTGTGLLFPTFLSHRNRNYQFISHQLEQAGFSLEFSVALLL
jgi:hypothetical protein